MRLRQRYALLTVDTEALPKRALNDHINRLVWGRHDKGTAGVREMCSIGDDFKAKHVFFVDLCGAYSRVDEMRGAASWLASQGQDVQLHLHPEVLPEVFWTSNGMGPQPALLDEYKQDARSEFVVKHFSRLISDITGKKVIAFRAGSFRWNASTIRAMRSVGIPLSFNNSMRAHRARQCVFSEPTNMPYVWSNGIIEVPVTEKQVPASPGGKEFWTSLTYPESPYFRFGEDRPSLLSKLLGRTPELLVFLLHSWSFLYWDENGHATYRDDQRLEGYRKLLARLTKDYDVITTKDFLDLHARGKIKTSHTVDVAQAEYRG